MIKTNLRNNYDKLISIIPDAAIIFDKNGVIFHVNNNFKELFTIEKYKLRRGQKLDTLSKDLFDLKIFLNNVLANTYDNWPQVFHWKTQSFTVNVSRLIVERSINYFVIFHDITALEQLEESRKKFTSNVAHELRTPLTSISAIAELIAFNDNLTSLEIQKEAKTIYSEVDRLSKLVIDLLEISKYDNKQNDISSIRSEFPSIKLSNYLERFFQNKLFEKKIYLSINDENIMLFGNIEDYIQIGINLIDNSLFYAHSEINLTIRNKEETKEIVVSDDGIGMDEEQTKHIFDRFYRTDESRTRNSGGTGLGLSIVAEIVKRNNGKITVKSALDKGTMIKIIL